ncbi:MAG TPA: hypothetical protein VF469_08160 [Kofleriaceae bacterium]
MTESMCDQVAERVALGEPLGELSEHAAGCASCQGLVAMSSRLARTHHAVDPGLGFSARMTMGAQHRIAVRRRRRLAAGLAATVAAGALGVLAVAHTPEAPNPAPIQPTSQDHKAPAVERDPWEDAASDADLAALVQLADTDRSSRLSARWRHIKKPLAAYKKLLNEEGDTP